MLGTDVTTAEYYGAIVAGLYKRGKPIPTNDVWIAATAAQHNLIVVSRDKHFNEVANLIVQVW